MAKVKVRGKGSVYKMERGKSRGKCRKWQLRAEIDGEFEGDEGYVVSDKPLVSISMRSI